MKAAVVAKFGEAPKYLDFADRWRRRARSWCE